MIILFQLNHKNELFTISFRNLFFNEFCIILQLSFGLSTPVSVPNRTLTMSVYYQMQYYLPSRASQWYASPDIMWKREIPNRALLDVYLPIEEFLAENGFVGRACLLRSICEAANSPFQHENMDLLEEIAHVILTPSQEVLTEDAICSKNNSDVLDSLPPVKQYLAAECLGKSDGDCKIAYPHCPKSPLDMFSQIYNLELFTE